MLLPSMAEAKLIAGQSGLDRLIRWVYKPEDMHFVKWVREMSCSLSALR